MHAFSFFLTYGRRIALYCGIVLSLWACGEDQSQTTPPTEVAKPVIPAPPFEADSAYAFIEAQLAFGPRVPGSMGHSRCGDYLIATFQRYADTVIVQSFESKAYDGKILRGRNIVASFNPSSAKRLLLAAHWDTRHVADQDTREQDKPIPGANDGGSGVAVLLEIARVLHGQPTKPTTGIDLMLFDLEDYGAPAGAEDATEGETSYCLGSQYWAKNKHLPNYRAYFGILLDMVGAKNAKFTMEGHSLQYAPNVMQKVWQTGQQLGFGPYFDNRKTAPIIDDHIFMNQGGVPSIDIIHFDDSSGSSFFPHWHTHQDDLSQIDRQTLKAVGQTLLQVLYNE